LRATPPDQTVKKRDRWRLRTILTALDVMSKPRRPQQSTSTEEDLANDFHTTPLFDQLRAGIRKMETEPVLATRRKLATDLAPELALAISEYQTACVESDEFTNPGVRAELMYMFMVTIFEKACRWSSTEAFKSMQTHDYDD
jgi:hypothetical protein